MASSARTFWLTGLATALVFMLGQLVPALHARLEAIPYDHIARAISGTAPASSVVLVHVDAPSIERLGELPWPADVHAALVDRLSTAGARVIAFTHPLSTTGSEHERLRAALRLLESDASDSDEERRRLRALLSDSRNGGELSALVRAIRDSGRVVLPLPLAQADATGSPSHVPGDARLVANADVLQTARQFQSVIAPPEALGKVAAALGHTAMIADGDGVVRRDFTAVRVGTVLVPSLATAIAATALPVPLDKVAVTDAHTLQVGRYSYPLAGELSSLNHPLRAADVTSLSYQQVLENDTRNLESLRDAIVLVQPTSAAGSATVKTSLGPQDEAIALAAATISLVDGAAFRHTTVSRIVEWCVAVLIVIIAAWGLPKLRKPTAVTITLLVTAGLLAVEFIALSATGVWLQLTLPAVALVSGLLTYAGASTLGIGGKASTEDASSLRSLGQTFHRQGQLDLAFETFRRCPMDANTMELLYALGSDYERRHQYPKALAVYSYMGTHDAGYRDLRARRAQVIRRGTEYQKQLAPAKTDGPAPVQEPSPLDPAMATWPPKPERAVTAPVKRKLGRYEIERELGKGAMGVVYLGRDPKINRVVAIKAIPLAEEFEEEDLAEARARFFREAEMAGRLNHPAIVTVYDAGEDQGLAYIAMEYLRGQHLSHFADAGRLLPAKTVMMLAARVADALHYAHRQNVVHRDIKPANIMFNPESDELKITDFGIARLTDASRTKTGIVLGTPSFMSPEQLEGRSLDGRSDLFALGVSLYQLLTGQLPFRADSMPRLMQKIANEPHGPINLARPDLPPCIVSIVDKVLAKSPEDRYETGAALAAALRSCAQAEDVQW